MTIFVPYSIILAARVCAIKARVITLSQHYNFTASTYGLSPVHHLNRKEKCLKSLVLLDRKHNAQKRSSTFSINTVASRIFISQSFYGFLGHFFYHPDQQERIYRGLAWVCGSVPEQGDFVKKRKGKMFGEIHGLFTQSNSLQQIKLENMHQKWRNMHQWKNQIHMHQNGEILTPRAQNGKHSMTHLFFYTFATVYCLVRISS